jgi:hypothetical protein
VGGPVRETPASAQRARRKSVSLAAVGLSFVALENQPEGGATSTTVGGIVTASVVARSRSRRRELALGIRGRAVLPLGRRRDRGVHDFLLFSLLCIVSFVLAWRLVPETKGRSLEEIQER